MRRDITLPTAPRTTRRRLLAATAVAGLLLGSGTACGADDTPTTDGKLINVFSGANTGFTPNFNPFSQTATPGTLGLVYEGLLFFNRAKADEVQPLLATSYAFTDDRTITFTLREGAKWSDGKPITAADVVFTFELIKKNPKLNIRGMPEVATATATDPTHVTVAFTESAYTRVHSIAGEVYIVPKHVWESIADPSAYTNEKPVGSGPFTLTTFSPQNYVLERNASYWETGKPKIKGVRYQSFASNESGTAALAAGQLDWSGMFIPDLEKQYVSRDPEHNKWIDESTLYLTNLVPNLARAPFDDVAVRKAVSAALDREQIHKLAFAGHGALPGVAALPRPLYDDYIKPEYRSVTLTQDRAESSRLLEGAGYAKGADGIYAKGGKKLSITTKVVSGYTDYISALQIIQQSLKEVGIDFKFQEVSYAAFATAQQVGDFDMIITNAFAGIDAYSWYYNEFATAQTAPLGKPANANYARYSNPEVDRILATIAATDPKQTDTIKTEIQKIQDIIVRDFPYIPIQQSSALAEYRTANATGWPTTENHYALALPFNGPDAGIVAKNLVPVG